MVSTPAAAEGRHRKYDFVVDQLGAEKDQSITVRLQRDESHGRTLVQKAKKIK